MSEQISGHLSSYAKRFARRKSIDGGKVNPMPRPFHYDYYPKHTVSFGLDWKNNTTMNCENKKLLDAVKIKKEYQTPRPDRRLIAIKKYDHERMNYYDFDKSAKV